jgi:hypothetical protein
LISGREVATGVKKCHRILKIVKNSDHTLVVRQPMRRICPFGRRVILGSI